MINILDARKLAAQWLEGQGITADSECYEFQLNELVRIIWMQNT
jgi:hypothetical protein